MSISTTSGGFQGRLVQGGDAIMHGSHLMAEQLQQHRHALCSVQVVLDQQHPRPGGGRVEPRGLRRRWPFDGGEHGEVHDERGASSGSVAVRLDSSAMQLHETLRDGEPDTHPTLCAIESALGLCEELEHVEGASPERFPCRCLG